MARYIQIQWTAAHLDEAREISQRLIEKGLVACASIIPLVESWYVWEGEMQTVSEVKVFLKTTDQNYPKIEECIRQHHSYEVPEILMFYIEKGSSSYLQWIRGCTQINSSKKS